MSRIKEVTDNLLQVVEGIARERYDGHLTMMRFTTGWKVMFGTPNLDGAGGREEVWNLPAYKTLAEALLQLVLASEGEARS